ncbi:MAG: Sec-independent protein translocase protein TatB [Egibacteraceae bacterium]
MNPSFGEMLMLAILALVIFGPERLPEVARNAGKTVAKFRREANNTLDQFRRSADLQDLQDLRNELRAMSADLRPRFPLTGSMAMRKYGTHSPLWDPDWPPLATLPTDFADRPYSDDEPPITLRPSGPPPFDPDAT